MGSRATLASLLFLLLSFGTARSDPDLHNWYQKIEDGLRAVVNMSDLKEDTINSQTIPAVGINPFPCEHYSVSHQAANVHELTPYDIKVVGSIGDSITAALFARASNILEVIFNRQENRGHAWSGGGKSTVTEVATMPNILKVYSPKLTGFATGSGDQDSANARMNVGISGAVAKDLSVGKGGGEARVLVEKMKSDPDIDFENDWKVITLWIGANDQCAYCGGDKDDYSAELYIKWVDEALHTLSELPRTFVNLVLNADMTEYAKFDAGIGCTAIHLFACSCAVLTNKGEVKLLAELYKYKLRELVDKGEYERDDFTIVLQPFFGGVKLPDKGGSTDLEYFAPDCFHLSPKGHRELAIGLWNNMVEPEGSKTEEWDIGAPLKCPSPDSPFLYTRVNSQRSFNTNSFDGQSAGDPNQGSVVPGLIGVVVGSVAGASVVVVGVAGLGVGVVWYMRKRRRTGADDLRRHQPSDRQPLVEKRV